MMTLDECYELISALNEEAHGLAWDTWIEADRLEEEGDDGAEDMRDQASMEQQIHFNDLVDSLDRETREAIFHYRRENDAFRDDFDCWYGYEDDSSTSD